MEGKTTAGVEKEGRTGALSENKVSVSLLLVHFKRLQRSTAPYLTISILKNYEFFHEYKRLSFFLFDFLLSIS